MNTPQGMELVLGAGEERRIALADVLPKYRRLIKAVMGETATVLVRNATKHAFRIELSGRGMLIRDVVVNAMIQESAHQNQGTAPAPPSWWKET